ncbi:MAG: site-specific integrase [Eubacterium sp.]|nr:site-specific integrase [Eubacterium sp.]
MPQIKARKDNKGRALLKGECQRTEDLLYCYTYTDPLGRRKRIYAATLMELRKKENELKRDQMDGLDVYTAGNADVNFLYERYISTKTELRQTTRANYEYMYDMFVRDTFGKKKINTIKYSDVLQFYYLLLEERDIKINTLDNIHCILHPTFQLAVRDDIIRNNPTEGVMAEIKKRCANKSGGIRHALTPEQQKAFLDFCREGEDNRRWAPLFTVMFGTGARVGEIIGLRWEDVDIENRLININHTVSYLSHRVNGKTKSHYVVSLPKTEAGIRKVPMMEQVYEAFLEELEYQQMLDVVCRSEIDGMSGFIFCNRFGTIHNPQGINRAIKRIYEDYNAREIVRASKEHRKPLLIDHFSCHHMRHTFCSRLCENESNVKVIQSIMGHKDIQTTLDIYAEVTDDKKTEAVMELSKKLDVF